MIALGSLFAIGLLADEVGRRTRLPRVTLLILLGVLAGPAGFNIVPSQLAALYEFFAITALTMVAFLLGGALSRSEMRRHGRQIAVISLTVVIITLFVVAGGLIALGVAPVPALLLAGIATATAPAATQDVIKQTGADGEFTQTLRGIVAIDDAWALIAFSLVLIVAETMAGNGNIAPLQHGVWEVAGAIIVGAATGFPAAFLTGRLRPGEPMQTEALAIVFLCAGFSVWLEVSFLLAGIVAGAIIVNFATHHTRAFHEIENIEWPFLILFFFLAGASLQTDRLLEFGVIGAVFIFLRTISRILGGWIGGTLSAAPKTIRRWIGIALLPQAGVAVGMALVAGDRFPELRQSILTITIATTIAFEIFGPIATRIAIDKAGDSHDRD